VLLLRLAAPHAQTRGHQVKYDFHRFDWVKTPRTSFLVLVDDEEVGSVTTLQFQVLRTPPSVPTAA
jgi:hypothetical protein